MEGGVALSLARINPRADIWTLFRGMSVTLEHSLVAHPRAITSYISFTASQMGIESNSSA